MIDPDGLQISTINNGNTINIISKEIYPCDIECYCLEDDKEYKKFIDDIEKNVRRSFEYRKFIEYLRENMNMNQCSFLKGITNEDTYSIKIEIHHYPFTLHDIVDIVIRKRLYYKESVTVQMCSKETMELHYKLLVGLIPLSETVHKLAHNGRLFIPVDKVIGRYNLFVDYYKPFCTTEQLETLERIEKYSYEQQSKILDTTILNQNTVSYDIKDNNYVLPNINNISNNMIQQIKNIKDNNYVLPNVNDIKLIEDNKEKIKSVVSFDESLIVKDKKYSWL